MPWRPTAVSAATVVYVAFSAASRGRVRTHSPPCCAALRCLRRVALRRAALRVLRCLCRAALLVLCCVARWLRAMSLPELHVGPCPASLTCRCPLALLRALPCAVCTMPFPAPNTCWTSACVLDLPLRVGTQKTQTLVFQRCCSRHIAKSPARSIQSSTQAKVQHVHTVACGTRHAHTGATVRGRYVYGDMALGPYGHAAKAGRCATAHGTMVRVPYRNQLIRPVAPRPTAPCPTTTIPRSRPRDYAPRANERRRNLCRLTHDYVPKP